MANITATALVNIDVTAGASAVNYTPTDGSSPILAINCIGVSGSGIVRFTPYRATTLAIGGSGTGGRLRIITGGAGNITSVEIAAGGSGYADGAVPVKINDTNGTGGVISCTASGGALTSVSVTSQGTNYTGAITFNLSDFIPGVTYDIVPLYIEQISGAGTLRLMGLKLPVMPYMVL
jgi:hypothetical protein